jgi:hypothetical protein
MMGRRIADQGVLFEAVQHEERVPKRRPPLAIDAVGCLLQPRQAALDRSAQWLANRGYDRGDEHNGANPAWNI